jgi:hypothetical protein
VELGPVEEVVVDLRMGERFVVLVALNQDLCVREEEVGTAVVGMEVRVHDMGDVAEPSPSRLGDLEQIRRSQDRQNDVSVLWQRGEREAAITLGELWNQLAQTRRFALYAPTTSTSSTSRCIKSLPEIVRVHSHPRMAGDPSKLASAVDHALGEVVGSSQAGQIYSKVAEQVPRTQLARAGAVLMWLSNQGHPNASRVLDRARRSNAELMTPTTPAATRLPAAGRLMSPDADGPLRQQRRNRSRSTR